MAEAHAQARNAGALHVAFPALVHESPTVALAALPDSDLVAAVTPAMAHRAVEAGQLAVLPWLSVHPGVVWLRRRSFDQSEQAMLDSVRVADTETHAMSVAFCARHGLSADCG